MVWLKSILSFRESAEEGGYINNKNKDITEKAIGGKEDE